MSKKTYIDKDNLEDVVELERRYYFVREPEHAPELVGESEIPGITDHTIVVYAYHGEDAATVPQSVVESVEELAALSLEYGKEHPEKVKGAYSVGVKVGRRLLVSPNAGYASSADSSIPRRRLVFNRPQY